MNKYSIKIKAGSTFHHHSRRINNNNLQIDEDIYVDLPEGIDILINGIVYKIGIKNNDNNLPFFFSNHLIILKKDTKYINNNFNEDNLGFTKRLEVEQEVYFNNGTCVEISANIPMYAQGGDLQFILTSPVTGYTN